MSGGGENEDRVQKGKALRFTGPGSKNENYVAPHIAQVFPFFPSLNQNPSLFYTTKALLKVTNYIMHAAVMFSNNGVYLYPGNEVPRNNVLT